MVGDIMKNPLNKRLPKELIQDFGKYIVIFIFLAGLISMVSGFLVADGSMIIAYNNSFEKYNIEDGNIELTRKMDNTFKETMEDEGLTLYNNFYVEETTNNVDSTLRIFKIRDEVNKICVMSGSLPSKSNEIAIDRMYADNNKISVGDTLTVANKDFTVTGLVALSDYSALFSDNSDMMFDAIKFGVAVINNDVTDVFGSTNLHYDYSWIYDTPPTDENDAKVKSHDILKAIYLNDDIDENIIKNYTPQYSNQAIHFTGDDMGGDRIMFIVLLYIVTVIIAFVTAITTNNTLNNEASIIGTLRASGYSKNEILQHYLTVPLIVNVVASIVGNVLGYTCFKDFFANAYYGSYSLPTFEVVFNIEAFILTTIVPFIIMLIINVWIISKKLELSPLRFLRHDLVTKTKEKAIKISTKIDFFTRFRLRVIFQNVPNYIVLFFGILFANFIFLFGLMFSPLLSNYQDMICNSMIAKYQYFLEEDEDGNIAETKNPDAEKYSATGLKTLGNKSTDDVTIYGIVEDSKYIDLNIKDDEVYVSSAFAEKYNIKIDDILNLKEPYGNARYGFIVTGIYDYPSSLAVFMSTSKFNYIFNQDDDYFTGYFSNELLYDIDEKDISSIITQDDLTKVSRQLERSMGNMMSLYLGFGAIMFMLLIFLLSKLVIEKNANSISMTKILGYSNLEIGKLYVLATALVTVLSMLLSIPICNGLMLLIFKSYIAKSFSGWLPYYVEPITFVKMFLLGIVSYCVVAIVQLMKIKKIPMTDALKNVE